MERAYHSIKLDKSLCIGCTNCVKRCPTEAIRVRDGRAKIISERCIDCGECIRICVHKAKKAVVDPLGVMEQYRYTIALPAPSLYGQITGLTDPADVGRGLLQMGFTEVYDVATAANMVTAETRLLLRDENRKKPLISSACPVVVRLIRDQYPELIDNILPLLPPVELAARIAKAEFVRKTGADESEVGAIFLSPCAAKATSMRSPLGYGKSKVDAVVAIRDVYPGLIAAMNHPDSTQAVSRSLMGIGWGTAGGESQELLCEQYLAADGIENVIRVLGDLEDEKIRDLEFVELNACSGGCVGGVLTVENPYIAKARLQQLRARAGRETVFPPISCEWEAPLIQTSTLQLDEDISRAMGMMLEINRVEQRLSGMDCGACGAPSCRTMAEDIVLGYATEDMCIYRLKEIYQEQLSLPRAAEPSTKEEVRS